MVLWCSLTSTDPTRLGWGEQSILWYRVPLMWWHLFWVLLVCLFICLFIYLFISGRKDCSVWNGWKSAIEHLVQCWRDWEEACFLCAVEMLRSLSPKKTWRHFYTRHLQKHEVYKSCAKETQLFRPSIISHKQTKQQQEFLMNSHEL